MNRDDDGQHPKILAYHDYAGSSRGDADARENNSRHTVLEIDSSSELNLSGPEASPLITPTVPGDEIFPAGKAKFEWFSTLEAAIVNVNFSRSVMLKVL
jgi:hypothetical protein